MRNGRRQTLHGSLKPKHERQASSDPPMVSSGLGLRDGRLAAVGPPQDDIRGRRSTTTQSDRAGDDYGPFLRRRLLRGHRHRPGAQVPEGSGPRGLLQPAELHRGHLGPIRAAAARRDRQACRGQALCPR